MANPGRGDRSRDVLPDKLRGGYYTSAGVAAWLCAWAIRSSGDRILEPSCGDGAFLLAAAERLIRLGGSPRTVVDRLTGIEIVAREAARARARLAERIGRAVGGAVKTGDFFEWWQRGGRPAFDVVLGNPPFIRYQTFPEPHRRRALEILGGLGLSPNRLTNIWVPFVAAAVAVLRPGGRLALVLPAELLQVKYAAQLRAFLTDRFTRIDVVACNELFFEKAEQEVVLLLADGALAGPFAANPCRVALTEARTVDEVVGRSPRVVLSGAEPKTIRHDEEKWLKYFLSRREIGLMRALRSSGVATSLSTHASVDVGVVTGNNDFFVLTSRQVERLGRGARVVPLVSRTAQLEGARVGRDDWRALAATGDRVHLLHLAPVNVARLGRSLSRYIEDGERRGVHRGYKCSIREPWYAVPSVWVPQGFVFRQIHDFPRFVFNAAGATCTDTLHRLTCKADPERTVASTYTWLTAASAEIEGRSYGGGVLELEPTEAERLLMPSTLEAALPLDECDRLTRAGRLDDVLAENDRRVLGRSMGLSRSDRAMLRGIWTKLRDRRHARRRRGRSDPR